MKNTTTDIRFPDRNYGMRDILFTLENKDTGERDSILIREKEIPRLAGSFSDFLERRIGKSLQAKIGVACGAVRGGMIDIVDDFDSGIGISNAKRVLWSKAVSFLYENGITFTKDDSTRNDNSG